MAVQPTKRKYYPWGEDNPEEDRNSPDQNQFKRAANILNPTTFLDQLFGKPSHSIEETKQLPNVEKSPKRKPAETLIFHYMSRTESYQEASNNAQIKEIVKRLKEQVVLLEKSETSFTTEISKIKVEQLPQKPGVYYILFFEWLISLVSQLRAKVEEGKTWLTAMTTKKKKVGYWKMYKKHGTTFGLSNERTLATQSG